jgi:hypothetical protein
VKLLDWLEGLQPATAPPDETLAEALTALILTARDEKALEAGLARHGLGARRPLALDELFRTLIQSLPAWRATGADAPGAKAQLAMSRLVSLARDRAQADERFTALVHGGIAEFNRGGLWRAGRVFELAEQLLEAGQADAALGETLRSDAHKQLDFERLRRLLETPDRRAFPQAVLRFFRVFAPAELVDHLGREPRRERREIVLSLLEAHGASARGAHAPHLPALARERGPRAGALGGEPRPLPDRPGPDGARAGPPGVPRTWAALVEHGLRTEPALGDCAARLAHLGSHDLDTSPEPAGRLIAAVHECLPPGFLTPLPPPHDARVLRIVTALRATRMPEVHDLLQRLAACFPTQEVGRAGRGHCRPSRPSSRARRRRPASPATCAYSVCLRCCRTSATAGPRGS